MARESLSSFDFSLFINILEEWESCPTLMGCFNKWKKLEKPNLYTNSDSLHILSFNVRGLSSRAQEVFLLSHSFKFDIMILLEVGAVNFSSISQLFPKYRYFYQPGENSYGGVIILTRNDLNLKRINCQIPNVCVLDLELEKTIRIIGVYGSESNSWEWRNLSSLCERNCVEFGDFNVDLEKDERKSEALLKWADSCSLAPFQPDVSTSLRSNRIIDYAFSSGIPIQLQTYEGGTTSDYKPIIAVISTKSSALNHVEIFIGRFSLIFSRLFFHIGKKSGILII
jgi:hypothetical protein